VLARYLGEHGLRAEIFETEYGGDAVEADVQEPAKP
jgi:putative mRNA 3-end processing factor